MAHALPWKYITFRNPMEKNLQARYLNSQDQLIISLNQQIEAMLPLKQSYSALQRYQIKLTHDFESLLSEHDQISGTYTARVHELLAINEQLDAKKNRHIEQLRALDNHKAKLTLDRKNLMASCETLNCKFNMENEQSVAVRERTREIIDTTKKTEQAVATYKSIIAQIQAEIKLKTTENQQIEDQVVRRIDANRKAVQRVEATEAQIKSVGAKCETVSDDIKQLDCSQDELELRIREQLKRSKQLSEENLRKKEELANLNHQKEYYTRLIESELLIKEDLDISETKLNGLLERKLAECKKVARENEQLSEKIKEQELSYQKSKDYKNALTEHLGELARANAALLETMRRSCKEDEKVHQILFNKLQALETASIKVSDLEMGSSLKRNVILREKTNQFISTMKAEKSGSTWINELTDLENRV